MTSLFYYSKFFPGTACVQLAPPNLNGFTQGMFVWDQSGIRIIGIMQVSICLGAILISEYLEQNSRNIFRKTFLFRNIPNERALKLLFLF